MRQAQSGHRGAFTCLLRLTRQRRRQGSKDNLKWTLGTRSRQPSAAGIRSTPRTPGSCKALPSLINSFAPIPSFATKLSKSKAFALDLPHAIKEVRSVRCRPMVKALEARSRSASERRFSATCMFCYILQWSSYMLQSKSADAARRRHTTFASKRGRMC